MAELIAHAVEEVSVAWSSPMVVDSAVLDHEDHAPWDEEWSPLELDGWARVGRNAVVLEKSASATACIRLELWTGEPAMKQPAWGHVWTGEIHLRSARLHIRDLWEDWSRGDAFDLGQAGATWPVRIQHRRLVNDQEPAFPRDLFQVDLYLLQFWKRP
ncbi:hypothetical protein [Nonomuraea sediminis]|uniref:hypothetical protein n=1 Tax=Nonomuraea sediminis TaxID=2835864 RepID=UPI001BDC6457|nr:hypothetical protein [Nonomuraea sediminis]